jgi:hypothetical protein
MAAGLGFKTFVTGEVLTAADTNGYLMQGVNVFANAAARTAAITSPQEGQMSFLKDTDSTEFYTGAAWSPVGGGGMTLLSTTTLSGTSTTVSSISQAYKSLFIVATGISGSVTSNFSVRPNSSTGALISGVRDTSATQQSQLLPFGNLVAYSGGVFALTINNYTSTTSKPVILYSGIGSASSNLAGIHQTTSAVTSIQFTTSDGVATIGGTVLLYGVN